MKIRMDYDGPKAKPYCLLTSHNGKQWFGGYMSLDQLEQLGEFLIDFVNKSHLIEDKEQNND